MVWLLLPLIWAAATPGFAPAFAQERVAVRAGVHPSYGRIVFDWPGDVGVDAKIDGRTLTVAFNRPMAGDLASVPRVLNAMVESAALSPDGQTATFVLKGDYRLNSFKNGAAIVLDLLTGPPPPPAFQPGVPGQGALASTETPPPPATPPPPRPAPAATPAEPQTNTPPPFRGPIIPLRVAQAEGYSRLVMLWQNGVPPIQARQDGDTVVLTIPRAVQIDASRLAALPVKWVQGLEQEISGNRTTVRIRTEPRSTYRTFVEDRREYIVDIIKPADPSAAPPPAAEAQPQSQPPAAGQAPASGLAPANQAAPNQQPPSQSAASGTVPPPPVAAAPTTPVQQGAAPPPPRGGETIRLPTAVTAEGAAPATGVITGATEAPASPAQPMSPSPPAAQIQPQPIAPMGTIAVNAQTILGGIRLVFPLPKEMPAAVYRRAGYLWVVFDAPGTLDLSRLTPEKMGDKVSNPRQMESFQGTIARFELGRDVTVGVARRANQWGIEIVAQSTVKGPQVTVEPRPQSAGGADVLVKVQKRGAIHAVPDPEVGDVVSVVTTLEVAHAVMEPRSFVAFDMPPTDQGALIVSRIDDLVVRPDPEGAVITRPGGLVLTGSVIASAAGRALGGGRGSAFIDYGKWAGDARKPIQTRKADFERAAALSPEERRYDAMEQLAKFYIANRLGAEALGVLDRMVQKVDVARNDPQWRALRAAANLLLNRNEDAKADLDMPAFNDEPHAALQRALIFSRLNDHENALSWFERGRPVLGDYPPEQRADYLLAAATSALAIKDPQSAKVALAEIGTRGVTRSQRAMRRLMDGAVAESENKPEEAIKAYDEVMKTDYRPAAVRAELAKINLLVAKGEMPENVAIERLEQLRYAWRGDGFERGIIKQVADFHAKAGDYRAALNTLRNGIAEFPDVAETYQYQVRMNEIFSNLFLKGEADRMPPVRALGLFYDFRELTPPGNDGDEMIRKLADRLVQVELLDRAAELLDHQVKVRLSGTAQAQIALRLAVVYLLDRKPDQALAAIRDTRQAKLPDDLQSDRNRVEARALLQLGRFDEARDVVANDNTPEGAAIRADVAWAAQDWPMATARLSEVLAPVSASDVPLDDVARANVLRAAIAAALAQDRPALDRLRATFEERMNATPDKDAFQIVATTPDTTNVRFRELASRVASVDSLESFLKGYRDRAKKGGISAIN